MSSRNKYRNPPTPLGYVKREVGITVKYDSEEEDRFMDDLCERIQLSGILEGPELSIYKPWISTVPFEINPSSEEEKEVEDDEVVEIPVAPRQVELVCIDDPPGQQSPEQDVNFEPVVVKTEPASPKELPSVEKDPAQSTSTTSIDLIIAEPENSSKKKKKKSHHGKHKKDHREKTGIAKKYSSDESDDSDYSLNRKNEKAKDNYQSAGHKKKCSVDEDIDDYSSNKRIRTTKEIEAIGREPHRREVKIKESKNDGRLSKNKRSPSPCSSKIKDNRKDIGHKKRYSSEEEYDDYFSSKKSERKKIHVEENEKESQRSEVMMKKDSKSDSQFSKHKKSPSPCSSKMKDYCKSAARKKIVQYSSGEESDSGYVRLGKEKKDEYKFSEKKRSPSPSSSKKKDFSKSTIVKKHSSDEDLDDFSANIKSERKKYDVFDENITRNIKREMRPGPLLHGVYRCDVCNLTLNSESTYNSHIEGKRHIKALNAQNISNYDPNSWVPPGALPAVTMNKCPKPMAGYYRKKMNQRAIIQPTLDKTLRTPCPESDRPNVDSRPSTSRGFHVDAPRTSTSHQSSDPDFVDRYEMYKIPDPSKPGFYCRLCDSHSNSEAMWQNHIVGKRHLANVRKAPGTAPSKTKYIPAPPNTRPYLFDYLEEQNPERLPVVGLNQIREIRKPDINGVTYNCFLCSSCVSSIDIVNHVFSRKHREKYLERIKHPEFKTSRSFMLSDTFAESIITDLCYEVEQKEGSGTPEVYFDKSAVRRGC